MTRRLLLSVAALAGAAAALTGGAVLLSRGGEAPLATDPEGRDYVYRDGWIESR